MTGRVLMDSGPLVAYFCTREAHHKWAVDQFASFTPPVLTCEAVLAETTFLIAGQGIPAWRLLDKLRDGVFRVGLQLGAEGAAVQALMKRYAKVPMSLADACLVRLAEITDLPICTLDPHFENYRTHGRRRPPLILPHLP